VVIIYVALIGQLISVELADVNNSIPCVQFQMSVLLSPALKSHTMGLDNYTKKIF